MRHQLALCALVVGTFAPVGPGVYAAPPTPAGTPGICKFGGWSADEDPKGLNVRAAPTTAAKVVKVLPPRRTPPGESDDVKFAAEFDVFAARNGWFEIGVRPERGGAPVKWGWVHGSRITFALQTEKAFAAPDPRSGVVATNWVQNDTDTQFGYRSPSDCDGEWVRLLVTGRDKRERPAWVRGVCAIQETTCDGVEGDMLKR